MKFTVVTLFPQMIEGFLREGLVGQAASRGEVEVQTLNPREFTSDAHHTVDDKAFGGGDGMVMKVEPLRDAVARLRAEGPCRVVVLGPQGRRWTQKLAREYADSTDRIVLVCGRYAGIDNRFTTAFADDEISIGDFILNGGEVAACALIESTARLKPGVLGNKVSVLHDSFSDGFLECPQFTRPREVDGLKVPAPLLSGHHENIRRFERAVSVVRTALLRPDLAPEKSRLDKEVAELESLTDDELKVLGIDRTRLHELKRVSQ
jgi:tRNA (guanine37-N1)-methyltransferase